MVVSVSIADSQGATAACQYRQYRGGRRPRRAVPSDLVGPSDDAWRALGSTIDARYPGLRELVASITAQWAGSRIDIMNASYVTEKFSVTGQIAAVGSHEALLWSSAPPFSARSQHLGRAQDSVLFVQCSGPCREASLTFFGTSPLGESDAPGIRRAEQVSESVLPALQVAGE